MSWMSGIKDVALAYGVPEQEVEVRMYALAEQIHAHYCLQRGLVNHTASRPDQHVALSILGTLAGADWWLVREQDRVKPDDET